MNFVIQFGLWDDENVNNKPFLDYSASVYSLKVGIFNWIFVVRIEQLSFGWILFGVQYEPGIDDTSRQWEYIEWTMNQMIPFSRYV